MTIDNRKDANSLWTGSMGKDAQHTKVCILFGGEEWTLSWQIGHSVLASREAM